MQCSAVIGNEAWLVEHGAVVDDMISRRLDIWKSEAKSVILLGIRDESGDHGDSKSFAIVTIFAVADRLRPEAQYVVSSLQHQGIDTWVISGDNSVTARAVAQSVGIPMTNVIAGVLPHEKVGRVNLCFGANSLFRFFPGAENPVATASWCKTPAKADVYKANNEHTMRSSYGRRWH
jgi:cation transport ATPase